VYRVYVDSVARAIAGVLRRYGSEQSHSGWREIAADVPDLVQEAFARAFEPQMRRNYDGLRDYGPYLRQIARNVVIDHLRRRQRRMVREREAVVDESSAEQRPHEQPADLATMTIVDDYIASLSPEMRRVHEAMYVRGLSQREAAAALGLGRQVVRTLEARLRQGLRSALEASERRATSPDVPRDPVTSVEFERQRRSVTR
jgi:RNA polymerase sigma-70 factor (ECF subfamily)